MNTIIGRFGDELLFVHDSEDNTIGCITQNEMGWSQDLGMQFVEASTYYGRFENFIQVNGNSFKVYNISMPRINVSVSIGVVDSSYKVVYKGMLYELGNFLCKTNLSNGEYVYTLRVDICPAMSKAYKITNGSGVDYDIVIPSAFAQYLMKVHSSKSKLDAIFAVSCESFARIICSSYNAFSSVYCTDKLQDCDVKF